MPPSALDIPAPTGRGHDAKIFLESLGLISRIPPLRASDYGLVCSSPFQYYLSVRLGLARALSWSKALSRGSWFHKRLELSDLPPEEIGRRMGALIQDREAELRTIGARVGLVGDTLLSIVERMRQDALNAWCWFEAAGEVVTSATYGSFGPRPNRVTGEEIPGYFQQSHWRLLGREVLITLREVAYRGTPLVAQLDALYHDTRANRLWILDPKTCSEPPRVRLCTCPLEFSTRHYLNVTSRALDTGLLQAKFPSLPDDVQMGGMIHVGFQKPSIILSGEDRPYTLDTSPFKSGPRKGQARNEKIFQGDPSPDLFRERCRRWYLSLGEYEHLAGPRSAAVSDDPTTGPPVNFSITKADLLDEETLSEYHSQLRFLHEHATRTAEPAAFIRNGESCRSHKTLSPYLPFYSCPVRDWPEIIRREGFIQFFRSEALPEDSAVSLPEDRIPGAEEEAAA